MGAHKTKEEIAAGNAYASYVKGWKDGACVKAMDKAFVEKCDPADVYMKEAYERGYEAGRSDRNIAQGDAAQIYGHRPEILRLQSDLPRHVFAGRPSDGLATCMICDGRESDPVHEVGV